MFVHVGCCIFSTRATARRGFSTQSWWWIVVERERASDSDSVLGLETGAS